ncbi:PEP-CTERM sorting domain-containing protein (plasmid) [Phormidium sp. CLA17]|uniref:PEP-CTERM sorting domain-containing protein n=1 Tax=Leptolyngbya sp. Cla-17 TaxID=2803751 RepID=UPI0014930F6C|nr:PEP-CTERM sorting domain-containing protein [Leptolyngbya sp. Cla-17]MBM0745712.1 PEP-CTERM sorting domain-containing protein [Leptolyngbya sp. Cla-17]
MTRFLPSLATVAAGLTLGASVLSAEAAQALSFYDFNIQWADTTTTMGWIQVDDTPDSQFSLPDDGFQEQTWTLSSLLDASFTHEGTPYGKSDITNMSLVRAAFQTDVFQQRFGSLYNSIGLSFANQFFGAIDYGADGSPAIETDYADKFSVVASTDNTISVSLTERPSEAVPEPTTMAGLALAGAGMAAVRRRQQRKSAA